MTLPRDTFQTKDGAEHDDEFYAWLGRTITLWADVEEQIYRVFHKCLGADRRLSSFMFHRNSQISAKIVFTDALLKMCIDNGKYSIWKKIEKKLNKQLPIRNKIAHNPVVQVGVLAAGEFEEGVKLPAKSSVQLHSITSPTKHHERESKWIDIELIKNSYGIVRALKTELYEFQNRLPEKLSLPDEEHLSLWPL